MYSARSTSWISGIAAAVAMAVGIDMELSATAIPEGPPVWVIAATSLVATSLAGGLMVMSVRAGLQLAGCRYLALKSALLIPTISVLLVGLLATRPIETHAVLIDMKSGQRSSNSLPASLWIAILAAILIPGVVSYVVGRLSRGSQVPPNNALERTRNG